MLKRIKCSLKTYKISLLRNIRLAKTRPGSRKLFVSKILFLPPANSGNWPPNFFEAFINKKKRNSKFIATRCLPFCAREACVCVLRGDETCIKKIVRVKFWLELGSGYRARVLIYPLDPLTESDKVSHALVECRVINNDRPGSRSRSKIGQDRESRSKSGIFSGIKVSK